MTFIEERLGELEREKEELTEYEQLDKHRRALEYNLYDKELTKATEQLSQIEGTRDDERERQQSLYAQLRTIQDELQGDEETLAAARQALDRLSSRKKEKGTEMNQMLKKRSSVEVELQEVDAAMKHQAVTRGSIESQLEELSSLIQTCEAELEQVKRCFLQYHSYHSNNYYSVHRQTINHRPSSLISALNLNFSSPSPTPIINSIESSSSSSSSLLSRANDE